jgi:hypothetical protein
MSRWLGHRVAIHPTLALLWSSLDRMKIMRARLYFQPAGFNQRTVETFRRSKLLEEMCSMSERNLSRANLAWNGTPLELSRNPR